MAAGPWLQSSNDVGAFGVAHRAWWCRVLQTQMEVDVFGWRMALCKQGGVLAALLAMSPPLPHEVADAIVGEFLGAASHHAAEKVVQLRKLYRNTFCKGWRPTPHCTDLMLHM